MKLNLLAVMFLVLHAAGDYHEEVLEEFVTHIPDQGRSEFLRYALSQGYSTVERRPLKMTGIQIPSSAIKLRVEYTIPKAEGPDSLLLAIQGHPPKTPELFGELYEFYLRWHRVDDSTYYRDPRNTICFPNAGCIDISDTSIHP